jgi:hypothetical protein
MILISKTQQSVQQDLIGIGIILLGPIANVVTDIGNYKMKLDNILLFLCCILVISIGICNAVNTIAIDEINEKLDSIVGFCEHGEDN